MICIILRGVLRGHAAVCVSGALYMSAAACPGMASSGELLAGLCY